MNTGTGYFQRTLALATALILCISACTPSVDSSETITTRSDARVSVEVMHWLTSGRDAAALAVMRDGLIARGGTWRDTPMPGAGSTGRAAAVNRIVGGQPPDVFQFPVGAELRELAVQNLVAPVPVNVGKVFPVAIEQVSSHAGHLIAIPVSIRGENWLFYNVELLRKAGLQVPRTWPEFLATAAALKARGTTPLALGGQPWQERLLFNAVLLGVGGRDFYRQVYEHLNNEAIDSRVMLTVFETYGALRAFVDEGSPGRRWSQTTLMLVRGEAAFQVMGDWAKGEIVAAGLEPGKEIGCALAPASEASYIMMIDAFVFSRTHDESVRAGQALFARTIQEPAIQATLAQRLGAIPARIDLPATGLDVCSAHALSVVQDPRAQLLDPALSLAGGLAGAIDDSLSRFWNDRGMSAARGHALFREAVRRYR